MFFKSIDFKSSKSKCKLWELDKSQNLTQYQVFAFWIAFWTGECKNQGPNMAHSIITINSHLRCSALQLQSTQLSTLKHFVRIISKHILLKLTYRAHTHTYTEPKTSKTQVTTKQTILPSSEKSRNKKKKKTWNKKRPTFSLKHS